MSWRDQPLPEDAAIEAAHPMQTKRFELYEEAMRLVGACHSKGKLINLVNWLIAEKLEERSACMKIALEYGGRDAEAIAELIGARGFDLQPVNGDLRK